MPMVGVMAPQPSPGRDRGRAAGGAALQIRSGKREGAARRGRLPDGLTFRLHQPARGLCSIMLIIQEQLRPLGINMEMDYRPHDLSCRNRKDRNTLAITRRAIRRCRPSPSSISSPAPRSRRTERRQQLQPLRRRDAGHRRPPRGLDKSRFDAIVAMKEIELQVLRDLPLSGSSRCPIHRPQPARRPRLPGEVGLRLLAAASAASRKPEPDARSTSHAAPGRIPPARRGADRAPGADARVHRHAHPARRPGGRRARRPCDTGAARAVPRADGPQRPAVAAVLHLHVERADARFRPLPHQSQPVRRSSRSTCPTRSS